MIELLEELERAHQDLLAKDPDYAKLAKEAARQYSGDAVPDTEVLNTAFDSWWETDELATTALSDFYQEFDRFYNKQEQRGYKTTPELTTYEEQINERLGKVITMAGALTAMYALRELYRSSCWLGKLDE